MHEEFLQLCTDWLIHPFIKQNVVSSASRDYSEPSEGYHVKENTDSALKLRPIKAGKNVPSMVIVILVLTARGQNNLNLPEGVGNGFNVATFEMGSARWVGV